MLNIIFNTSFKYDIIGDNLTSTLLKIKGKDILAKEKEIKRAAVQLRLSEKEKEVNFHVIFHNIEQD